MDDLEITRLCARAAGLEIVMARDPSGTIVRAAGEHGWHDYEPLADYQQALELVERLRLSVGSLADGKRFYAENLYAQVTEHAPPVLETDPNLLRAICLCAARVQQSKENQK